MTNQLTDTSDFKGSFLNCFGYYIKALSTNFFQSTFHHTRTRNSDIDDNICFPNTMKGTRHKWIVLNSISEYNQLGRSHI
ncbi:Uncharacterised protein [Mycobacterium tuberculosis]|uniref:Uncharacterized protein n=1 Tax=Mycobacterium tuberculosis TaxID=1773 RepID=A0A655AW93_MYCTX|nr:Uncharacterised protein [Mycobacterium tuberculosis]